MGLTELSHLSLKYNVAFQSAVQETGFTGLCFKLLLLQQRRHQLPPHCLFLFSFSFPSGAGTLCLSCCLVRSHFLKHSEIARICLKHEFWEGTWANCHCLIPSVCLVLLLLHRRWKILIFSNQGYKLSPTRPLRKAFERNPSCFMCFMCATVSCDNN